MAGLLAAAALEFGAHGVDLGVRHQKQFVVAVQAGQLLVMRPAAGLLEVAEGVVDRFGVLFGLVAQPPPTVESDDLVRVAEHEVEGRRHRRPGPQLNNLLVGLVVVLLELHHTNEVTHKFTVSGV